MVGALLFLTLCSPPGDALQAKCSGCHGPNVAQADFSFSADLPRLAASRLVVPGKPAESRLWLMVSSGKMPPAESPFGKLEPAEADAIRDWITSLGPAGLAGAGEAPEPPETAGTVSVTPPEPPSPAPAPASVPTAWQRGWSWVGRLHIVSLHFPIVLLLLAVGMELWERWTGRAAPSVTLRLCLYAAALSCVPVVVFGWIHAAHGYGSGSNLTAHQWLGTLTALSALAAVSLFKLDMMRGKGHSWASFIAILVSGALVIITAHYGGEMVHGSGFMTP